VLLFINKQQGEKSQDRKARRGQAEQDMQSRTARTGQPERYRPGQAEQDIQNGRGRT
jgi:hypothetical protein